MRIISGHFKGRKITQPKNKLTRPLKDLTKESIFNILQHANWSNFKFEKSIILDLFAGVGSFGLECISRGAKNGDRGRGKEHGLLAGLQDFSETGGKMTHDFRRAEGDADAVGDTGSVKALHQVAFGLEILDQLTWLTFVGDPDKHEISMTRQRCKAQSRNIFLQQLSAGVYLIYVIIDQLRVFQYLSGAQDRHAVHVIDRADFEKVFDNFWVTGHKPDAQSGKTGALG